MRSPSLRQLSVFASVAKHLSFVRAAEELHLTQPAVSMQIKELEAARMTIGMVSTAEYFLPRLLARFRAEHPAVQMRLSVGNREELVRRLRDNEVDLAVMGRPPRDLDTRGEPFAAHPLSIIASPEHPLARRRRLAPKSLDAEEFILREPGSGTRAAMEQFFRDQRISPPVAMEMSSNETIKQAVIANMGLAFVSLHTVALELAAGQLVALQVTGLPLLRSWHIVNIQGKPLSPAAEAFRYFIFEHAEGLLAKQFGKSAPVRA